MSKNKKYKKVYVVEYDYHRTILGVYANKKDAVRFVNSNIDSIKTDEAILQELEKSGMAEVTCLRKIHGRYYEYTFTITEHALIENSGS